MLLTLAVRGSMAICVYDVLGAFLSARGEPMAMKIDNSLEIRRVIGYRGKTPQQLDWDKLKDLQTEIVANTPAEISKHCIAGRGNLYGKVSSPYRFSRVKHSKLTSLGYKQMETA